MIFELTDANSYAMVKEFDITVSRDDATEVVFDSTTNYIDL